MESSLMRVKDAAQLLGVSTWTVYRWIEERRLGATKIGRGSLRVFRESAMARLKVSRLEQPRVTRSSPGRMAPVNAARKRKRN